MTTVNVMLHAMFLHCLSMNLYTTTCLTMDHVDIEFELRNNLWEGNLLRCVNVGRKPTDKNQRYYRCIVSLTRTAW